MELFLSFLFAFQAQLANATGFMPFAFWKSAITVTCPTGFTNADGDLHVVNGQTLNIAPGAIKNYNSVLVDAGGIINITTGSAWVIIGSCGDITNNGTIKSITGEHESGTYTATAPDGTSLSYSITQAEGGDGGDVGGGADTVGLGSNGNGGGGGGGGGVGQDASPSKGGDGGIASTGASGGVGASVYSGNGLMGSSVSGVGQSGAGGGAGSRGAHGQGIYLKTPGALRGSGIFLSNGQAGGSGGPGGSGTGPTGNGGGGGGGGASGSGGKIVIRFKSNPSSITYDVSGGISGNGGGGGNSGLGGSNGQGGFPGLSGSSGSTDIATY